MKKVFVLLLLNCAAASSNLIGMTKPFKVNTGFKVNIGNELQQSKDLWIAQQSKQQELQAKKETLQNKMLQTKQESENAHSEWFKLGNESADRFNKSNFTNKEYEELHKKSYPFPNEAPGRNVANQRFNDLIRLKTQSSSFVSEAHTFANLSQEQYQKYETLEEILSENFKELAQLNKELEETHNKSKELFEKYLALENQSKDYFSEHWNEIEKNQTIDINIIYKFLQTFENKFNQFGSVLSKENFDELRAMVYEIAQKSYENKDNNLYKILPCKIVQQIEQFLFEIIHSNNKDEASKFRRNKIKGLPQTCFYYIGFSLLIWDNIFLKNQHSKLMTEYLEKIFDQSHLLYDINTFIKNDERLTRFFVKNETMLESLLNDTLDTKLKHFSQELSELDELERAKSYIVFTYSILNFFPLTLKQRKELDDCFEQLIQDFFGKNNFISVNQIVVCATGGSAFIALIIMLYQKLKK